MALNEYLNSNKAVEDYTELARQYGMNDGKFKQVWTQKLEDAGYILEDVNEDDIAPLKILNSIETAVQANPIFSALRPIYNADNGSIVIEPLNADGAWGHTALATKKVQNTELIDRAILPKAIYKMQRLDDNTFRKGGALVEWVMRELPMYVIDRITQAILVGGVKLENGQEFKAIYPIATDEMAVKIDTKGDNKDRVAALLKALPGVRGARKMLVVSNELWSVLAMELGTYGGFQLMTAADGSIKFAGATLVADDIVAQHGLDFILFDADAYGLFISGSGIETLSSFVIQENSQWIESRAYVAGSLLRVNSAVVGTFEATEPTPPASRKKVN